MARFTLRQSGQIQGTYSGDDEDAALDELAKEKGHDSFKAWKADGIKRDHFTCEEVKE